MISLVQLTLALSGCVYFCPAVFSPVVLGFVPLRLFLSVYFWPAAFKFVRLCLALSTCVKIVFSFVHLCLLFSGTLRFLCLLFCSVAMTGMRY